MISGSITAALVGEMITICSVPIALLAIIKLRTHCKLIPFFAGAATFLFFAAELESFIASLLFTRIPDLYEFTVNSFIGYAVWRYFTVALFEMGGIYVVFRYAMKPFDSRFDAVTFGLGFGGLEGVFTSGVSAFFSLSYVLVYNEVGEAAFRETFEEAEASELDSLIAGLKKLSAMDCITEAVRRTVCIVVSAAFVMMIFFAIRKNAGFYMKFALCLRAVYELGVSPAGYGLISNIYVILLIYVVMGALVIFAGYKMYKAYDYDEVDFRKIFL